MLRCAGAVTYLGASGGQPAQYQMTYTNTVKNAWKVSWRQRPCIPGEDQEWEGRAHDLSCMLRAASCQAASAGPCCPLPPHLEQGSSTFYYLKCFYLCGGDPDKAQERAAGSFTVVGPFAASSSAGRAGQLSCLWLPRPAGLPACRALLPALFYSIPSTCQFPAQSIATGPMSPTLHDYLNTWCSGPCSPRMRHCRLRHRPRRRPRRRRRPPTPHSGALPPPPSSRPSRTRFSGSFGAQHPTLCR